jgi:Zn-dependent protease with chaperone function
MDVWQLFLPLLFSSVLALIGVAFQRRIAANRAAQMAVGGAVGIGIVGFLGSVLVSLQFLAHYPASSRLMAWCQMFGSTHHPVSNPVGALAIAFSVAGLVGCTRFVLKHRAARRVHEELRSLIDQPILLDSSEGVFAYTLPGLQPLTVLSAGLVTQLDVDEQAVVLAHEQAHHQYRHDRFLVASRVASALFFPANMFAVPWSIRLSVGQMNMLQTLSETANWWR